MSCSLLCALLFALGATPGQTQAKQHLVSAGLQLGSLSTRDDTLVPLAFTGPAVGLAVGYGFQATEHRVALDFDSGLGVMSNRHGHRTWHIWHSLALGYLRCIGRSDRRAWAIGGQVRALTDMTLFEYWDDAHGYWLASMMLGPAIRHARHLAGHTWLEASADFGLVGWRSRPPRRRLNKQGALNHFVSYLFNRLGRDRQLATLVNTQQLRLSAVLRLRSASVPVGGGWGFGLHGRFARADAPEPYTSLSAFLVGAYGWGW